MTVRFSNQLVPKLYQPFWAAWQAGEFLTDAAALALRWVDVRTQGLMDACQVVLPEHASST